MFFSATPKLNFELGSPVSSVSDPDLSGISDNEPAKKGSGKKSDKPEEPVKPAGGSQSEGKVNRYISTLCS